MMRGTRSLCVVVAQLAALSLAGCCMGGSSFDEGAAGAAAEQVERDRAAAAAAIVAPVASCQNPQNRYCSEWADAHWTSQGADDAAREAATRNTCEVYARGTYRRGEPCARTGIVGACRLSSKVEFWYSEHDSARAGCTESVGGTPGGLWYEAAEVTF